MRKPAYQRDVLEEQPRQNRTEVSMLTPGRITNQTIQKNKIQRFPTTTLVFYFAGRILSRLLTHTHLPGLSSLDQMHLLALADTVSTCDADFAERLATTARGDVAQASGQEILPGEFM